MSSFHSVLAFNPASSKPAAPSERLVIIHYKGKTVTEKNPSFAALAAAGSNVKTNDGGLKFIEVDKFPSLCVSVPPLLINLSSLPPAVADCTLALWQGIQDSLVKSLIDAKRSKSEPAKTTKHSIASDEIDIHACVQSASATGNGKLSSAGIISWFDAVLTEPLAEAILLKNPSVQDDVMETIMESYGKLLSSLAAVSPSRSDAEYEQMRKALALAPEGEIMADRLIAKIDSTTRPKEELVAAYL